MEAYLEAIDVGCLRAATEGLLEIKDPANPIGDEEKYDRWNAKAKKCTLPRPWQGYLQSYA
jgi:hypothetical protein